MGGRSGCVSRLRGAPRTRLQRSWDMPDVPLGLLSKARRGCARQLCHRLAVSANERMGCIVPTPRWHCDDAPHVLVLDASASPTAVASSCVNNRSRNRRAASRCMPGSTCW
jgi:hypothetical protein